jgi:hypothetical protein
MMAMFGHFFSVHAAASCSGSGVRRAGQESASKFRTC